MISLDVIIPSFRLQSEYLVAIVSMNVPSDVNIRFLIISDNPGGKIPEDFLQLVDNGRIILIRNKENYGVSHTRNVGIDNSAADWILFLDDDVKPQENLLVNYCNAIKEKPGEIGFFGEVLFPPPINNFTSGICAGGILGGFSIGKTRKQSKCAPTANVIVKRSAIGDVRFLEVYNKKGACEEADFFLRIYNLTGKELQSLDNTPVYHDWWGKGKRSYERFIRINAGSAIIMEKFPEYAYYTFPNIVECLVFGLPATLLFCFCLHTFLPLVCALVGIITGECLVEFLRISGKKGISVSKFVLEVVLLKAATDIGRLSMELKRGTIFRGLSRRFDFFCDGRNINYQRFWAGLKFSAYLFISIGSFILIKYIQR